MNSTNFKKVKIVLWVILFANFLVAFLKIIVGSLIKSTSLTADGFHSLTDGSSNIVGLIGITIASRPIDKEHPYGHKKFETLAGLFIGGMLFLVGIRIIIDAINRFIKPVTIEVTLESLISLMLTLCINIFVSSYEYRQGKRLNSYILTSDSLHTRSDIFVSIGVLFTLVCVRLGALSIIDPVVSLIVSFFVIHAAYEIFKGASDILVDRAVIDTAKVEELTLEFKEVRGVHKIRSRGSEEDMYVDMHILVDPQVSVEKSHSLMHQIEKKLQKEISDNIQVIIHIEPYY